MKNTQELTIKEAEEALELLKKNEGNLTKEGKERIEQLEHFLNKEKDQVNDVLKVLGAKVT